MQQVNQAVEAVLAAYAAFANSKPTLVGHLTGHKGGTSFNLNTAIAGLRRAFEQQNRSATLAAELPQTLASMGWALDWSEGRWRAEKVVGDMNVRRSNLDAEALLAACRAYDEEAA